MKIQPQYDHSQNIDPFLDNSGTLYYCKLHQVNIYICDKPGVYQKLPNKQQLMVKIVLQGAQQNLRSINIQLTSDSQLQFNFQFKCNQIQFRRIKQIQKLNIQFRQYPQIIAKNFEKLFECKNNSNNLTHQGYQMNFTIFSETEGKFDILRKSEFKNDLIMEFNFCRSPEQHIQASVQYRYNLMRKSYVEKVKKYQQYRQIIRAKNPSLMMQIDKALKKK